MAQKLSFDEWKNSMSFLIDDEFDRSFLGSITPLTGLINTHAAHFADPAFLEAFLGGDSAGFTALEKLKAFVSVIGLSEERLKRIVSMVRYRFNQEVFKSEWSIVAISKKICSDSIFRQLLVEFFINGRNSMIGQFIPLYYLRNFRLRDAEFVNSISDFHYVERILNDNEIQGKYSNRIGAQVERLVAKRLEDYSREVNPSVVFDTQREFPLLNKNIDFLIPSVDAPRIIIECSYNITTGSGQSKRADQLVEFYSALMKHNANHRHRPIRMVNYCDGFGWVGRQNDLHRIYDASDYVINQSTLYLLDEIVGGL